MCWWPTSSSKLSERLTDDYRYGGKQRSRTPSLLREPGFQGQSQDHPRCITFQVSLTIMRLYVLMPYSLCGDFGPYRLFFFNSLSRLLLTLFV